MSIKRKIISTKHPQKGHKPAISVCVPVYKASEFIKECIDSILAQSFEDFELLLVDDGSTYNTWDIIKSYKDKRIKAFRGQHDHIAIMQVS
ncbi:MAG: glycosyltransferase [Paraprevotella sp.]|nr:glycosyltransferase [Paraprevotella sp.]